MSNCLKQILGQFRRRESGFSLLEALIAVFILGLVGVAVLRGFDTSYRAGGTLDERLTARNLIVAHIEAVRNLPYASSYPTAGDSITIPFQYTVLVETECTDDDITYEECTGNQTLQRVIVSVSRVGQPVMRVCTFRTPRNE